MARRIKLVTAGDVMGATCRQAKRVWRRYRVENDGRLVHRSRAWPSSRRKPLELRQRALARHKDRYGVFRRRWRRSVWRSRTWRWIPEPCGGG